MKKLITLTILIISLPNIYSQKNCNKYELSIPSSAIIGATINIDITAHSNFTIVPPEIASLKYLKSTSSSTSYMKKVELENGFTYQKVQTFSKIVNFKCENIGELTLSPIKIVSDSGTCYTKPAIIKVFPENVERSSKIDSLTMLPYIDTINDIQHGIDFFVKANLNKTYLFSIFLV